MDRVGIPAAKAHPVCRGHLSSPAGRHVVQRVNLHTASCAEPASFDIGAVMDATAEQALLTMPPAPKGGGLG